MGVEEQEPKPAEEPKDSSSSITVVTMGESNSEEKEQEQGLFSVSKISDLAPPPSWFGPKRILILFCVINLINYLDRGAIASNGVNGNPPDCTENGKCTGGSGIQGQFNLNNFEDGVLSSAFMVGLLVASPIFAALAKRVNPFRPIGVGLFFWTAAVIGCGWSWGFWSISIFRMLVGVGEASFVSLASPFIDDNAPPSQKTSWLGYFYMCIPVGYALGYIYGGLVGNGLGWRWAFWFEAVLMAPFVVMGFVMKPLELKGFGPAESEKTLASDRGKVRKEVELGEASTSKDEEKEGNDLTRFLKDMKVLLQDKVFAVNVLGYITYNFVVGAYSYWGPNAVHNIYNMANADMVFGGITVGCGLGGTIAGGLILDYLNSTISNAFKLLATSTFLGAVCIFAGFCFKKVTGFLVMFAVGELLVFAVQAPVNFVCLHCVTPSLRPLSMAVSTVLIHILGDVPSSPLVGVVQDRIHNWRKSPLILTSILFIAAGIWFAGIFLYSRDKFYEDEHGNEEKTADTA